MTPNERVNKIRKELGMTLETFGNLLGVTKVAISNIEKGNRSLTTQMTKLICSTDWPNGKKVNEDWLLYGTGDMFLEADPDEQWAKTVTDIDISGNELIKQLVNDYNSLPDDFKTMVEDYILKLAETIKKSRNG